MSRTDIDAATFANYLRQMCGDGSVEWSYEPMQTSVLLDMADMLDEVAKPTCYYYDSEHNRCHCYNVELDKLARANELESENAKLWELLLDTLMHPREYCEKHGIEYAGWDSANAHVDARLRELGIEVNE